VRIAVKS